MQDTTKNLLEKMRAGDRRALARLMTYVDNRHEDLLEMMATLAEMPSLSEVIGVTGPPGAGKSTLVDKLIGVYRALGKTVGVVAVDPSSPFSGGAVLGDRIRMQDHNADDGVFIRSLGSRGAHGGLSRAARDIVSLLTTFGFDIVIIETVGVGQTELDIMNVADTTVVVLVPESGDTIQTMKAGLMEIADIFVVNKSDREGADKIFHELKSLVHMSHSENWEVPVLKSIAPRREGISEIVEAITKHQQLQTSNKFFSEEIFRGQILEILAAEVQARAENWFDGKGAVKMTNWISEHQSPYVVVSELLKLFNFSTK